MTKRRKIIGAVLAGGSSSRMGRDKAFLPLNGSSMIQHVVGTLRSVFEEVVIVGGNAKSFEFLHLPVVSDRYKGCGPLAGIHAALLHSSRSSVFVLPCDAPFISSELVEYVVDSKSHSQTRITLMDDVLQPLCGLYAPSALAVIDRNLRRGVYGILRALKEVDHDVVPIVAELPFYNPHLFRNVNRPEEYLKVVKAHEASLT